MRSIEQQVLHKIQRKGRGWAFAPTDFLRLGSREAVDLSLHRLHKKGTIRRVIRGVYDYPRHSTLLGQPASPEPDAVAAALARKFGWRIQPSGATALNVLGLSTQVPGRFVYVSDGPDRRYLLGNTELTFRHKALKEAGFARPESALLVQALKALGKEHVTEDVERHLRAWLPAKWRGAVLKDTGTATGWVQKVLRRVFEEDTDGTGGDLA